MATDQQIAFAADIILNHRLFAAAPSRFNDPFDCDAPYSFDATVAEKIDRAIARIEKENPNIAHDEARRLAPSRYLAAETNGFAKHHAFMESQLGVVSLAAAIDNPLLWGHYADCHKGISIQFQFRAADVQQAHFFGNTLPVTYQKERPVINFYRDELTDQVRKLLLTKSEDWAYEKEWRIIASNRQTRSYVEFHPSLVGSIYLGCRIDDTKRKLVREWLSKLGTFPKPSLIKPANRRRDMNLSLNK